MNSGAFGENFPYSNFHDLNMDWIIKIAKDFLDQYTNIQSTIDTGLENINNTATHLQELLQEWYDTHSSDIANQLADALEDISTELTNAITQFNLSAEQKAEQTLESIPSDYTALYNQVLELKTALTNTQDELLYNQIVDWSNTFDASHLVDVVFFTDPYSIMKANRSYRIVMEKDANTFDAELSVDGTADTLVLGVYGNTLKAETIVKPAEDVGRYKLFSNGAGTVRIRIYECFYNKLYNKTTELLNIKRNFELNNNIVNMTINAQSGYNDIVFFQDQSRILKANYPYLVVVEKPANDNQSIRISYLNNFQSSFLHVNDNNPVDYMIINNTEDIGRLYAYASGTTSFNISIYRSPKESTLLYSFTNTGEEDPTSYYVYCQYPFRKNRRYSIKIEFSANISIDSFGLSISTNGYWNNSYTPIIANPFKGTGVTRQFVCKGDYKYALIRLYGVPQSSMNVEISEIDQSESPYFFVASNDALEKEKTIADFICTGNNDEYIINMAHLQSIWEKSGRVKLSNGVFHIQSFNNTIDNKKVAIPLTKGPNTIRNTSIEGTNCPYGFTRQKFGNGTTLYIDETGYNSLGSNDEACVIKTPGTQAILSDNAIELRDIGIYVYGSQKKITAIDLTSGDRVYCERITMVGYTKEMLDDYHVGLSIPPVAIPVDGFTGIKMGTGSNDPQGYSFRNIGIWGFYEGFKVGGEHLLMEQCYAALCIYGYTFGNIPEVEPENINSLCHPITMINCSDERNQNFPCFKKAGHKQHIAMIGLNLEYLPNSAPGNIFNNYMVDETNGEVCGEITYTIFTSQGNVANIPLWANGSGQTFKSRNAVHKEIGTTAERLTYSPNYGQTFYDTTTQKMYICTDPANSTWTEI